MADILDEDDAWSYSFPPSNESLPLPSDHSPEFERVENKPQDSERDKIESDLAILNDHLRSASTGAKSNSKPSQLSRLRNVMGPDSDSEVAVVDDQDGDVKKVGNLNNNHSHTEQDTESISSELARPKDSSESDLNSQVSSSSSPRIGGPGPSPIEFNRKEFTNGSATHSLNSLTLQSPFLSKATPANPHTTREDASSVISRESQKNALTGIDFSHEENMVDKLLESPKRNSAYGSGDFRSNSNATISLENHRRNASENINDPDSKSPKVISYRKSRRTTSEGNFQDILESATTSPKEKYDPRLYDEEKFKDTKYRYAAMKRNVEFHELFTNIDLTDRLIDDFACALSREILLQGRIYVSEHHICFNSSLLGWVTNVIIPQEDIIAFEKRLTAGIFPNGIAIETKDEKYTFASFLSRDTSFNLFQTVWETTTGKKMVTNDEKSSENGKKSLDESASGDTEDDRSNIESYIMSIDEDGNGDESLKLKDSTNSNESNEPAIIEKKRDSDSGLSKMKIVQFKPDSQYQTQGPDVHKPTEINDVLQENEIELCNEVIDVPMGIVFEILFSSKNDQFFQKFLLDHDSSELSSFDEFTAKPDEPKKLHRTYCYKKALGYSIGPKSTTCQVEEIIEHLNFNEYIQVTTTTRTPDVPLGNAFCVKTRFRFTWAKDNKTNLQMSYFIEWTGRSWIKSVIEKLTLTGQTDACKDLIASLKQEIEQNTVVTYKDVNEKQVRELQTTPEAVSLTLDTSEKTEAKPMSTLAITAYSTNKFIKENIVSVCYLIFSFLVLILVLQLMMFRNITETNTLVKNQMTINSYLVQAIQSGTKNVKLEDLTNDVSDEEYKLLWDWVDQHYGKKLSAIERLEYLTLQLNSVFLKQSKDSIGDRVQDIKEQVKGAMDGII